MNTNLSEFDFTSSTQTSYSTDPILEYIFDTPEEATAQAVVWGYSGYRAYLVNGTLKYVPCSTAAQYREATRLYIEQGAVVAQGKEVFGDKLVGYQFTEKDAIKGDPIYTLGNFSITTNTEEKKNNIFTLADSKRSYVGTDFTSDGIDNLKSKVAATVTANIRFDKSNLEKYVTYQSLSEKFRITLQEIVETFPASMHVIPYSITNTSVFGYFSENNGNYATFSVYLPDIHNPYSIDFFKTGLTATQQGNVSELRSFAKNYKKYEVYYNGVAYPIINAVLPENKNDINGLVLTVKGNPFVNVISGSGTINANFYLKPNKASFDDFYATGTDLATYLLNPKSTPLYKASFNVPRRSDTGSFSITPESKQFPMYDEFNVDIFNNAFDEYTSDLESISSDFDLYKTNLIARFLTAETLQEYDTPERKTYATWQSYGNTFDDVKKYADGIAYMSKVSYDKIDNVPDVLLKNFAHMLGWKTYEIEQDDTLIESLFDVSVDRQGDDTPAEIDIELWRRIIINSFYLFKSKGTRKSIEFVLELVGIPIEVMDINEYVYVAEHVLPYGDYYNIYHESISDYPIDTSGYPTVPPYVHFQADGGSMLNNAQNIGPYDGGKLYIDTFRKFGDVSAFDLQRVIDNKKSWVVTTGETSQQYELLLRDTNYTIKDSRLVINSKEVDAAISTQKTFDYYVYSFYKENKYIISASGNTVNPSKLTFNDYVREVTAKLIDPKNRKVVKTYPVLSKIYWDYLEYAEAAGIKTIDYTKTLSFINTFDTYWVKLVQQFIPATSIFLAGRKFTNSETTKTKYQYKHGLNDDKDWLGTDGSEFQDDALKPSPIGNLQIFHSTAKQGAKLLGDNVIIKAEATLSPKLQSYLIRGGYYEADNYDFYRHNDEQQNVLIETQGNYGSMTGLTSSPDTTSKMYFVTASGISGSPPITGADMSPSSGATFDASLGAGFQAGLTVLGEVGDGSSVKITLASVPIAGDNIYPLTYFPIFYLNSVIVEKDVYYELEGDIMFDTAVSGNTTSSYVGLMPLSSKTSLNGVGDPTLYITDRDMVEGSFGKNIYEKYNWVHMKTKFKSTNSIIRMMVMGKDIHYVGQCTLYLKNFTVNKVTTGINFITPPPLPHVCYYDRAGVSTTALEQVPNFPEFDPNYWGIQMGIPIEVFPTFTGPDEVTFTANTIGTGMITYFEGYDVGQPIEDMLYYYTVDVAVTQGGVATDYDETPIIYIDLFNEYIGASIFNTPIKIRGNAQETSVKFEGYYYYSDPPLTTPRTRILVENKINLADNYYIKLSKFNIQEMHIYYTSEDGTLSWYKQPHAFGYSKNTNTVAPDYAIGGSANSWVIPYVPTDDTQLLGDLVGFYENYMEITSTTTRVTTPLMHINGTYLDKFSFDTTDTQIDINLSNTCNLGYNFYSTGITLPTNGTTPNGVTINNQLFISGEFDYTLDGFYPLTGSTSAGLGPFYNSKSVYGIYGNISTNDTACVKQTNTVLSIVNTYGENWDEYRNDTGWTMTHPSVPDDFNTALSTVSLANNSSGNYLVSNRYNLIKISASLIYDSDIDTEQTVTIKLVGADGSTYNQKSFIVGGSNNPDYTTIASRTLSYTFEGFYYINDEVYLKIYPQVFDCVIKNEEAVDFEGGYILSGSTESTALFSYFKADKVLDTATTNPDDYIYTYFTGDTYQYMIDSEYDTIRFVPTGVFGVTTSSEVYNNEYEYYMGLRIGTVTDPDNMIVIQSDAVDRSQYSSDNGFIYGLRNIPNPFTGVTWDTYDASGTITTHTADALTGTTYSILRKSYVKVYESDVVGINDQLEEHLLAFYKKNGYLKYRLGYSKYFFDDPVDHFYRASDSSAIEVFTYGSAEIKTEADGIHLLYNFAKDLAGYPVTGEFIARVTAKDPCGNFASIYVLLCIDVKDDAASTSIGNINTNTILTEVISVL